MSLSEVRLLLVDDDPSTIRIMSRMLADYPDQRFATSGEAALRLARETTPDLILLDDDMPGMSGLDVCNAFKADPALADIPVVFVTSHGGPERQVAALMNGAADFLVKPLSGAQLTARVRACLRDRGQLALLNGGAASRGDSFPDRAPRARILIVDDDTASIHILRHAVEAMGEPYFARGGDEALEIVGRLAPDLILLDAHMPGLDGFDVCRSLKAQASFRHVPIAFVTRFSDPRYEERALDLGAADFIAKPYTSAVLQARVRNLLTLKRQADAGLRAPREPQRLGAGFGGAAAQPGVLPAGDHPGRPAARAASAGPAQAPSTATSIAAVGAGGGNPSSAMLGHAVGDPSPSDAVVLVAARQPSLASFAHAMGNPLNALLGFAGLMEADPIEPLSADQARRLERVLAGGRELQRLMREMIECAEAQSARVAHAAAGTSGLLAPT